MNDMGRREFLKASAASVVGFASPVLADDPPFEPVQESPRRRLGMLLQASPFEYEGCPAILAQLGENAAARLNHVNDVGSRLGRVIEGVWGDDVGLVAAMTRGLDDHQLFTEGEREVVLMLWAVSEIVAFADGQKVATDRSLDLKRLRQGAGALTRWANEPRLGAVFGKVIGQLRPARQANAGGDGGLPPRPPDVGQFENPEPDAPHPTWIGPGGDRAPRLRDTFHASGHEFIHLMKALADEKDKREERARVRSYRENFSVLMSKELGRPLHRGEIDDAWMAWSKGRPIAEVAYLLDRRSRAGR